MNARFKTIGFVSALLLAGTFAFVPNAKAHTPQARELCGIIQAFDSQAATITIQTSKRDTPVTFAIRRDTRFLKNWKFADGTSLKEGLHACVYYRSPFFGKPFVTKVVWTNQN